MLADPRALGRRASDALAHEAYEVAADVTCIPLSIVNAYLIGRRGAGSGGWVLVDAGLYLSTSKILRAVAERFGDNSRPAAIILTHGHFDHVGSLKQLAAMWDVPIYAHTLELPYLTGRSAYPPPDPAVGGGGMAMMSPLYPRQPIDVSDRVRPLPEDGSVPGLAGAGWRWIHTPGHTAGHVALFRDGDRTLIAGDAFVTTKQESAFAAMMKPEEVHGPPAYFTPDWDAARRSVQTLAALEPEVAATGHGRPMDGEPMRRQLRDLAANFDQLARPRHGRYVKEPARTDESGAVVSVPPPVLDPRTLIVAGVTAGALIGLVLAARSRHRHQALGYGYDYDDDMYAMYDDIDRWREEPMDPMI